MGKPIQSEISPEAKVGSKTKIWHYSQVREGAIIGADCIIGKNCYIDHGVTIGDKVKIQNNSSLYYPAKVEDGVFIGPHVILTNDERPRAVTADGQVKGDEDWTPLGVHIRRGASIGAGSVVLPGVTIGEYAMVGAGSVVTRDVPDLGLVYGNPAKLHSYVDKEGKTVREAD